MDNHVICIAVGAGIVIILVSIINQLRSEIASMKIVLDRISKQGGIPDMVSEEVKGELMSLISKGKRIEAIKRYRVVTGIGLKEAKDYIDQLGIQRASQEVNAEVMNLILEGKNIEAIKRYREITGIGLKEAKDYIDQLSKQK